MGESHTASFAARPAGRTGRAGDSVAGTGPRATGRLAVPAQPHFESPQLRHVMQPSIMTTAAVLHLRHSWAPSG